jgi:hypothetical protein
VELPDHETALRIIRRHSEDIASGAADPYPIGTEIWATAMGAAGTDGTQAEIDCCKALWLIWGALTDWVETRPDEKLAAEAAMRRAATEWVDVADDAALWRAYLDRWVYDEMGYSRDADPD